MAGDVRQQPPGGGTAGGGTEAQQADKAQEVAVKLLTGKFTLSFLKALMTTGIYPADHPAVVGVSAEPFDLLKRISEFTTELTFQGSSSGIGDELTVEGVLPEGVPFGSLIQSSLTEHFARKFVSYFERNHLVSFSIKPRIGREEFQRVVAVFVEHKAKEEEEGIARVVAFGDLLIQRGIVHVTAMSREEIIGGDRPLPWRVKMAISRLRKDLRTVPLYSEATHQELQDAKMSLIQDITRPLRKPQFLKELLANTDLVTAGVPELEDVDMTGEIIRGLHEGMLTAVSWEIVSDMERAAWGEIQVKEGAGARRMDLIYKGVLKGIALRLREVDPSMTREVLRHLFHKKILAYADLPEVLQQEVLIEKWTEQFLGNWNAVAGRFLALEEADKYGQYLRTFTAIFSELVKRGRFEEANAIADALFLHAHDSTPGLEWRKDRSQGALDEMGTPEVLVALVAGVNQEDREVRAFVLGALAAFGESSLPVLLDVLGNSKSSLVRRDVMAAIERFGDDAHVPLLEILGTQGREWYIYRNAILLLSKLECVAAADDIRRYLAHPHVRVREEALAALEKMLGRDAEPLFVPLCQDPERTVARKAIAILARMGCRNQAFLDALARTLTPRRDKDETPPDDMLLTAIDAVNRVGSFTSGQADIRNVLLQRMEGESSVLGKLWKKKNRPLDSDVVRSAIISTLGVIGDIDTARRMEGLMDDPSILVRERIEEAIRKIAERSSHK